MMLTTLVCALGLGKEWSADADDAGSRAVDLGKTGRLPSDLAEHCQLMILVLIFVYRGKVEKAG